MTGLYGPIVTIEDARQAIITHLESWTPAYIAELSRQAGISPGLPGFRGFAASTSDTFPVCVVAVAGTSETPERHGDRTYTASWSAAAAAVVSAKTRDDATRDAALYGAAIRACLVQQPGMSGWSDGLSWDGETVEEVAFDDAQAIVACVVRFTVTKDSVINGRLGPSTPPVDPSATPADLPTVDTTITTLTRST